MFGIDKSFGASVCRYFRINSSRRRSMSPPCQGVSPAATMAALYSTPGKRAYRSCGLALAGVIVGPGTR